MMRVPRQRLPDMTIFEALIKRAIMKNDHIGTKEAVLALCGCVRSSSYGLFPRDQEDVVDERQRTVDHIRPERASIDAALAGDTSSKNSISSPRQGGSA